MNLLRTTCLALGASLLLSACVVVPDAGATSPPPRESDRRGWEDRHDRHERRDRDDDRDERHARNDRPDRGLEGARQRCRGYGYIEGTEASRRCIDAEFRPREGYLARIGEARLRCRQIGHLESTEPFARCVDEQLYGGPAGGPLGGGRHEGREPGAPRVEGCALYEHDGYRGRVNALGPNTRHPVLRGFNDRLSSLALAPRCELTVYEHADFQGASRRFGDDVPEVGRAWNDRVSSAICSCRR